MSNWKTRPPCKGCEKHELGCREGCENYETFLKELEAEKKQKKEFEQSDRMLHAYRKEKWAASDRKKLLRRK